MFSHLHRGTLELCQSDHWVHLPDPSPPIAQFGTVASSRKCLGGSKHLPFKNDVSHCFGGPSLLQNFFGTLPQICASTQSCLGALRTITSTSWLVFFFWHAVSTVGPYVDKCVPFQIMSNQLNVSQVDSNQVVETSQGWSMETGCTWGSRVRKQFQTGCSWAQFRVSQQRVWILM